VGVFVSFELSSSEMGGLLNVEMGVSVSFWVCLFTMGVFVSVLKLPGVVGVFVSVASLLVVVGVFVISVGVFVISMCGTMPKTRCFSWPSKPFITDTTMISAIKPKAMPATENRLMKETKLVWLDLLDLA